MFFRHLFIIWFFLFTLTSSVAWAVGDHSEQDHSHGSIALDSGIDHEEPLPWAQDGCSDHCCHASAHALGLVSYISGLTVVPLPDHFLVSESTPSSLTLTPPFHPPIA